MKKILIIIFLASFTFSNSQTFKEVAKEIGVGEHYSKDFREMSGGVVIFDFNNDGWEDIFTVGGLGNPSALFQNMKDGTFNNVTSSKGLSIDLLIHTVGAAAADLDNDGDADLIVTTNERADSFIFENRNGVFKDIAKEAGIVGKIWNTAVSFVDFDLDGDLDIYFSSYVGASGRCDRNFFYENLGDMKFREIGEELGVDDYGCSLASTFSDYDNDGDFDLLVANDFGLTIESNKIFENQYPERKFLDVSELTGFNDKIFGMGIEGGDFDEDGDMDYYTTNIGPNKFYVNDGNKGLVEKGVEYGIDNKHKKGTDSLATSWGISWFDYDNDSDFDLFVSNGNVILTDSLMTYSDPNLLYQNDGNGNFTEVGEAEGIADIKKGRGIGLIDFDNDGDMDIIQSVVTTEEGSESETDDDRVNFFRNNSSENGNNWIQFKLRGNSDNKDAIGSKIEVFFEGRRLIAETVSGGSSYMSQHSSIKHFGLGVTATQVDKVIVTFPNGDKVIRNNLPSNQRYEIIQAFRTTSNIEMCYGDRFNNKFEVFQDTTVIETLTSTDGIDSIVTYVIDVFDEIKVNSNLQLCYGAEFAGFTWNTAGEIDETYRSYKGCDSTVTYNITVNPPEERYIDTTICYGGLLEKIRITRDRRVEIPITDPNGCDSLLVYNVTVNDGPKFSTTVEVCRGLPYRGTVIENDTVFFDSFKTSTGCDSIYEQKIVMLNYGQKDSIINIFSDEIFEGKFYTKDTTLYRNLGLKAENGCDSVLALNLSVTLSSVGYDNNNLFNIKLFPNPAESFIEISYNQQSAQDVTIELYNTIGQKIATIYNGYSKEGINKHIWKFSNKNLLKGMYMLRITDKDKYRTEKLIIQ